MDNQKLCWSFIYFVFLNINFIIAILPTFDRHYENVTAIIGNTVQLPCFISNLGDHKVAWIKVGNTEIIAIGDFRVTHDERIRVQHSYLSDWSLIIQQVNEDDCGEYICQVNTEPQMIKKIILKVLVPPKIIEEKSTINTSPVNEGDTLTLYCHVDGSPKPKVSWYFRKRYFNNEFGKSDINTYSNKMSANNVPIHEGNSLVIENINRNSSGYFECIANNSVPPAASRKIKVTIEFPPEITTQTTKLERFLGTDAGIECKIKANPLVNHYWIKNGRVIESGVDLDYKIPNNFANVKYDQKYEIIINNNNNEFLTISSLIIRNLTKADFGYYDCYAVNKFKTIKATVELKEIILPKKPTIIKNTDFKVRTDTNNNENVNKNQIPIITRKPQRKHNHTTHSHRINNDIEDEIIRLGLTNNKSAPSSQTPTNILLTTIFANVFIHSILRFS